MAQQGRYTTLRLTYDTPRKRHNSQTNTWYCKDETQRTDRNMALQGRDTTHRLAKSHCKQETQLIF